MATLGLSKVFILDKYFAELQKFWETERKLQGKEGAPSLITNVSARPFLDHVCETSDTSFLRFRSLSVLFVSKSDEKGFIVRVTSGLNV
jgi:hypothetical protein